MYQDNSIKMHFYVIGSAFNPRKRFNKISYFYIL